MDNAYETGATEAHQAAYIAELATPEEVVADSMRRIALADIWAENVIKVVRMPQERYERMIEDPKFAAPPEMGGNSGIHPGFEK